MSPEEKQVLLDGLQRSHQFLKQSVGPLSDEQFHAKPDASRWSVGEIMEHLCIMEYRIPQVVIPKCLAGQRYEDVDYSKDDLADAIRERATRVNAPTFVHPGAAPDTVAEGLGKFAELRAQTIAYVQSSNDDLRHYRAPHPMFGPLDGFQWLNGLAAHTERHTKQIDELVAAFEPPAL